MDKAMKVAACLLLVEQILHEDEEAEFSMAQIRVLCSLVVALAGAARAVGRGRRWWVMPRQLGSFESVTQQWPEDLFKKEIRVGKKLFTYLCKCLGPYLERKDTRWRKAIPTRRSVAIALKKLATGMRLRDIASKFEVGKSTVGRIVTDFCEVVEERLMPIAIRWPFVERMFQLEAKFCMKHGNPDVVGAIDYKTSPNIYINELYIYKRAQKNELNTFSWDLLSGRALPWHQGQRWQREHLE